MSEEKNGLRDAFFIEEGDVFSDLTGEKSTSLFLGRYTLVEVMTVLGKKSFFKEARKRRLWPLAFELDSSGFPVQRLKILLKEKKTDNLVVDLKIREGYYSPRGQGFPAPAFKEARFLILEWLTLQNPSLGFAEKKFPLPGQAHPGLNLGKKVLDIFVYLARLTGKDGLLAFPAYFHNAVLFSRYFYFINPRKQGEVEAIRDAFSSLPFKQLAWVVHRNCVKEDGQTYEWKAEEQACPVAKRLKAYFNSKAYREEVRRSRKDRRFTIDWESFRRNNTGNDSALTFR